MPELLFSSSGSSGGGSKDKPFKSPFPKKRPTFKSPKPVRRPNMDSVSSMRPPKRPESMNSLSVPKSNNDNGVSAPKAAPVNIDADKSSSTSAAGSTGGASGKVKASKAQEENVTVRKKARGTAKYQVTKASKNPLVVNKKKTKVV